MRKSTINLIVGILIGMFISGISDSVSGPRKTIPAITPVATSVALPVDPPTENVEIMEELHEEIAPGLQIIQVPPPLDINGLHPYQCYYNGHPVSIPKEVVRGILASREDPSKADPNFNIHDFTENLKRVKPGRTRELNRK
jgi:hypothetical protein